MPAMKELILREFGDESEQAKALLQMDDVGPEVSVQYPWIFTHGLASMVNAGIFSDYSDQLLLEYLKNAGEAFYLWGKKKGEE